MIYSWQRPALVESGFTQGVQRYCCLGSGSSADCYTGSVVRVAAFIYRRPRCGDGFGVVATAWCPLYIMLIDQSTCFILSALHCQCITSSTMLETQSLCLCHCNFVGFRLRDVRKLAQVLLGFPGYWLMPPCSYHLFGFYRALQTFRKLRIPSVFVTYAHLLWVIMMRTVRAMTMISY